MTEAKLILSSYFWRRLGLIVCNLYLTMSFCFLKAGKLNFMSHLAAKFSYKCNPDDCSPHEVDVLTKNIYLEMFLCHYIQYFLFCSGLVFTVLLYIACLGQKAALEHTAKTQLMATLRVLHLHVGK